MGSTLKTLWIALLATLPGPAFAAATLGNGLEQRLMSMAPTDSVSVILKLSDRVDLRGVRGGRAAARGVMTQLRERASRSQPQLLAFLAARGYLGRSKSFWIDNSVAVRLEAGLVSELERRADVLSIELDEPVEAMAAPVEVPTAPLGHVGDPVWGVLKIRADQVWEHYGLDGSGIVVGSLDTGVDPSHPALAGKWVGGPNGWRDFAHGQAAPYDDHGHGTHTIGTMVGGDGPGTFSPDIGIAPGARFIAAKVLQAPNLATTVSTLLAGAQWMMDPDDDPETDDFPHVINNSWGHATLWTFHDAVVAWRAAGIATVFAIGNSGPADASTIPPGNNHSTLGIGATDVFEAVPAWSSRGPGPLGFRYPADRRKPDLSAPGDGVWSSLPGGAYAAWGGTSMSSPHVAGTIALMLQAHGGAMSPEDLSDILMDTAVDFGTPGYDYSYGYGRLDAFAAVTQALNTTDVPPPVGLSERPSLTLSSPTFGRMVARVLLPQASEATLEVVDVMGRRLDARDVGSLGAGAHTVEMGRGLRAGVYWVRLTCGDVAIAHKAVMLR